MFLRARQHVIACMPLYALLVAYFLTAVLGNLLYLTTLGADLPALSIRGFNWKSLDVSFGPAFWLLVLIPFVAVPTLSLAIRSTLRPLVRVVPGIPAPLYGAILVALYGVVIWRLYQADAWTLLVSGRNAIEAVDNRFAILAAVGAKARICLMSLLVFLSVYSSVKASRHGGWWSAVATFNAVMMVMLLTALAMKWPLVLYIFTLGTQTFITAQRWALIKSAAVMAVGVGAYLLVSVALLKMIPLPDPALMVASKDRSSAVNGGAASVFRSEPARRANSAIDAASRQANAAVSAASQQSGRLFALAINRMAISVPYYWALYEDGDNPCGHLFDSWLPHVDCQPSLMVYAAMWPDDEFAGRGSAPAAFHIYEFARAGWPGVVLALLIGSLIIGGFMALWPAAQSNDLLAAMFVMGAPTGYMLSQLPCEGILLYDHGIVWWGALVAILSLASLAWRPSALSGTHR